MKKKTSDRLLGLRNIALREIKEPKHAIRSKVSKEGINELADSITKVGLIQPIVVVAVKGGYEVVAGHRRFLACKLLKLREMRAIVLDANTKETEVMKLHENLIRQDVNVVDEANFIRTLMKLDNMNQAQIAKTLGRSEGYISGRLDLLKYDGRLLDAVSTGAINFSVARELNRLTDDAIRNNYLHHGITSGITPAIAKQWVDDWLRMQDLQKGLTSDESEKSTLQNVGEISMPCGICNEVKLASEERMVRVCEKCFKELKL